MNDALARLIDLGAIDYIPPSLVDAVRRYAAQGPDITITDQESLEAAAEYIRLVKALENQLETDEKAHKRPLNDALVGLRGEYANLTEQLSRARLRVRGLVDEWQAKIAAARAAEQARIDREEAQRKARLQARADKEAEKGNYEKAAVIEQQAAQPQARAVAPAPPPPKGLGKRQVWRFEITDAALVPREYLIPDMAALGGVVRSLKDRANIPGVRVWMEETDVTRAAE